MQRKYKLVIRGWILHYVDQLVEEYNEITDIKIDREEMIEKCISEGIDRFLEHSWKIRRYLIHGNCLPMEVLQDLINYMDKLEKNISGLKSDAIYYDDEPIKIIQENKNALYVLAYYKRNNIYNPLKEMPDPTVSLRNRKQKVHLKHTTWEKIRWYSKMVDDFMRGETKYRNSFQDKIEILILHTYQFYLNKDYYSYLKLPLNAIGIDNLIKFGDLIEKHRSRYLKADHPDGELVKTLQEIKEEVDKDIEMMKANYIKGETREAVYPFKVILGHKK